MALAPIEQLFRKSTQYQEALQEFTDGATARLAEIRSEYETLSAALQGNVAPSSPPVKKTTAPPPAKKAAPPKPAVVEDESPLATITELPSVVEDIDEAGWVIDGDEVAAETEAAGGEGSDDTVDLTETDGVWGDPNEPDDY